MTRLEHIYALISHPQVYRNEDAGGFHRNRIWYFCKVMKHDTIYHSPTYTPGIILRVEDIQVNVTWFLSVRIFIVIWFKICLAFVKCKKNGYFNSQMMFLSHRISRISNNFKRKEWHILDQHHGSIRGVFQTSQVWYLHLDEKRLYSEGFLQYEKEAIPIREEIICYLLYHVFP
jgi:hypothetical protein